MNPASGDARAKRVGAAIRRRRQVLDLEQRELAGLVGVHVNTVQKWENGTHYPGRKLGKLEAVLDVTLDGEPEAGLYPHVPPEVAKYVRARWRRDPQEVAAVLADLEAVFSRRPGQEQAPGEDGRASRRRAV
jgi:transcriptional regulator with XRE-family HTH domain